MAAPTVYMQDMDECILKLRDKTLDDGIHAVFAPNNGLVVHRRPWKEQVQRKDVNFLHEVKRISFLHDQFTRKLVNECHGIFLSALRLPNDVDESTRSQNIKKISQRYHSVLLACLEDLDGVKETSEDDQEFICALKEMFTEIELIWSLIEVLLFDMQSRSLVLYRLLDWIQWHFTAPAKRAQDISNADEPCEHPDYWPTVLQFVLQGNVTSARSLLKVHKLRSREDFLSMDELLRKMPMYIVDSPMSWNEFQMRWRHWQEECRRRHAEHDFSAEDGLELVSKVLCGDMDSLHEKSYLCETWYHFLISYLLYTDPLASITSLGVQARAFMGVVNSNTQLSELDNIILAAMELDVMTLIRSCCCYFNDGWWFVAHMTDLLYRGNYMNADVVSHPQCLCESLILNYAESLMTHFSLWEVGLDYLDQCEEHGREHLELYLQRIPLDSEQKAKKVMHLAKQRHLDHLVKSVCKVMTMRAIKNEMYGTALSWVIQSKDVHFATDLANRWMKEYSETGKFHCFDILKNLGFCMLVSDKLTFLGKYCEFHKLYQENEFKAAASLLVSLLSSNLVPKQFQMVLLHDALPLLEAPEPVFTMVETTQLMACLEGLSFSNTQESDKLGLRRKERLIRHALAKNLGRSFIVENSLSQ